MGTLAFFILPLCSGRGENLQYMSSNMVKRWLHSADKGKKALKVRITQYFFIAEKLKMQATEQVNGNQRNR